MKAVSKIVLLAFLFVGVLSSCNKEEDKDNEEIVNELIEAKYSEKDTETIKSDLESSGMDMVSTVDGLTNEEAVDVLSNLAEIMEGMEIESVVSGTPVEKVAKLKSGNVSVTHVFTSMQGIVEDEPETFTEAWDMIVGKYTWDAALDSFVKTDMADAVIIEFPGGANDQSNTAVIKVDNFGVITPTSPLPGTDEKIPELLSSINYKLTYNGATIMDYVFKANFLDNGVPTSVSSVLTIGGYVFDANLNHSPYTKGSYTWSLKHKGETIIELHAGMAGDWSEKNIDANTHVEQNEWYTEEYVDFEEIIQNANTHAQLMDVKMAGKVNIKEIVDAENELWDKYDNDLLTEEEVETQMVSVINENAALVLLDASKNQKIAEVEVYYPKEYVDRWEYCHGLYDDNWNWIGDTCVVEEEVYNDYGFNFVFADSSKVDAEVYFTENFTRVENEFIDIVNELEEKYDIDLD